MDRKKYLYLAAVFLYAAAVFQLVDEKWFLGIIFFASATCMMCLGSHLSRKGKTSSDDPTKL